MGFEMKKAIVIGSGAGGAAAAKELQGKFEIKVIEEGKYFAPFRTGFKFYENLRKIGILFDEKLIQLPFPHMRIRKSKWGDGRFSVKGLSNKLVLVNGVCLGGSTAISTGSAKRVDDDLREIGIDLDREFEELESEIPLYSDHKKNWNKVTRDLFDSFQDLGLDPQVTKKMGDHEKCVKCGRCVLGCNRGSKWDARDFIKIAMENGAKVLSGHRVESLLIDSENGMAEGIYARTANATMEFFSADLIIIAAGGLGTPVILDNSGIRTRSSLFVEPVLCIAAEYNDTFQDQEVMMPFNSQMDGYTISPYFDWLSYFFNRKWYIPSKEIISLMIKLADRNSGSVAGRKIFKKLNDKDIEKLDEGIGVCKKVLMNLGIKKDTVFYGTVNAGHPGGMMPLTENESATLHSSLLPENVYIADATLFPGSVGNPQILTIMALAKKISKKIIDRFG